MELTEETGVNKPVETKLCECGLEKEYRVPESGKPYWICPPCTSERLKARRAANLDKVRDRDTALKQKMIDYRGGKCNLCGYLECNDALEFHHIVPAEKNKELLLTPSYIRTVDWNLVTEELDKCICLCANCHRKIHYRLRNKENPLELADMLRELRAKTIREFEETKKPAKLSFKQSLVFWYKNIVGRISSLMDTVTAKVVAA